MLKHGTIPANLHFDEPNPQIPFEDLQLRVSTGETPFPHPDAPLIAGINSFGFGGTNAHAILEAPTHKEPVYINEEIRSPYLLPISARCSEARVDDD